MNKINIKLLSENAKMPTRGSADAAGYDLYGANTTEIVVPPQSSIMIPTDIACEFPIGTFGAIFPRSGIATKRGLRLSNLTGIIDADYRGNIKLSIYNDTTTAQTIAPHERIAQLIVIPFYPFEFNEVSELNETERGAGGFGSTGKI